MNRKHGSLVALVAVALLVAACGPGMATPTPGATEASVSTAAAVPTQPIQPTQPTQPTQLVVSADLPVDPSDWHVLGSADAPVTLIEYSDFQ
jgi:protein-disulfide isomerase